MRRDEGSITPLSARVYVRSAACTRITNRPEAGFYDLCLEAGRKALEGLDPLRIDSFYVASMDPAFSGVTGELTAALATELGVMPKETLGIRGTSSAGGVGCIPSFKDIASGLHRYSLLISCEQMNPIQGTPLGADERARERERVQGFLAGVVDPSDQAYGLTMVAIGDLLESAIDHYAGLSRDQARQLIRRTTLEMYQRAARYPFAQFYGNRRSAADYDQSPWLTPFYRRDDVVPISSGACAIVFSSAPPDDPPHGRVVQLRGVGQGIQHPALTRRFGPMTVSPSIRRAVHGALGRAGRTLEHLRRADVGFPHDAFPSIARIILKEMGFSHVEAAAGLLGGHLNPCGGLLKCGHPVGCSGELQLVRAFQIMTGDPSVPEALRPPRADSAFTVSVGAALTNIVALCLEAHGVDERRAPTGASSAPEGYVDDPIYGRFERAMSRLPRAAGVVLAHTRTALGWVHLLQCAAEKRLALADERASIGALVAVRGDGELNRVERTLEAEMPAPALRDFGIIPPKTPSQSEVPNVRELVGVS